MVGVQISLERTPMQFFYLGNGTRTAANHATLPEKSGTIALALTDKIIVGFSAFLPGGTTMLGNNCEKRIPVTGGSESFYFLSSQGNFAKGMIRCTRQSTSTGTPSILIEILTT